jgi:hypothetical protein
MSSMLTTGSGRGKHFLKPANLLCGLPWNNVLMTYFCPVTKPSFFCEWQVSELHISSIHLSNKVRRAKLRAEVRNRNVHLYHEIKVVYAQKPASR